MIVCANCHQEMRPKKNGVTFLQMAGTEPYKLWDADLWECQQCGNQVLYTAPRQQPIAEHFEADFADKIKTFAPQFQARGWTR